jgi:thioredoxin reductase (NADPH)
LVVVLGGGYSAVDWAIQISKIAKSVSLVYRGTKLKVLKEEEEKLYATAAKVFMNWTVREIVGTDGILIENNEIKSLETLPFDYIIVQYGCIIQQTSYSFNKELKLNWNKVVVDKKQKSNLANVYACGDCCTYEGKFNTIKAGMEEVDKIID